MILFSLVIESTYVIYINACQIKRWSDIKIYRIICTLVYVLLLLMTDMLGRRKRCGVESTWASAHGGREPAAAAPPSSSSISRKAQEERSGHKQLLCLFTLLYQPWMRNLIHWLHRLNLTLTTILILRFDS